MPECRRSCLVQPTSMSSPCVTLLDFVSLVSRQHQQETEESTSHLLQFEEQHCNSMGAGQSSDKLHCNRYLDGQGPPSLTQQANDRVNGTNYRPNGCQPEGQMNMEILHRGLPGFSNDNTIQITFIFPDGIQTEKHPHPGQTYAGLQGTTYLPDNFKGRGVLRLVDKAFYQQLLFTVATGKDGKDKVTASIPLKMNPDGESRIDDYPDSDYLETVRKLLKDKGIE
uniref:E3 ubiquitin-protein ligase DTX3L1 isoform X1 n=1 Tax=Solea senegalensis TaxID=28829 RepID=UPI001CD85059|nr:E3 ubiquitin-protein ligase DTX3L1 isoform X1 [Solea senegalensis]